MMSSLKDLTREIQGSSTLADNSAIQSPLQTRVCYTGSDLRVQQAESNKMGALKGESSCLLCTWQVWVQNQVAREQIQRRWRCNTTANNCKEIGKWVPSSVLTQLVADQLGSTFAFKSPGELMWPSPMLQQQRMSCTQHTSGENLWDDLNPLEQRKGLN